MNTVINAFAVIGGFTVLCCCVLAAAITADALAARRHARRHPQRQATPTPAEVAAPYVADVRQDLQARGLMTPQWTDSDAATCAANGITLGSLAIRPYDHQRDGL